MGTGRFTTRDTWPPNYNRPLTLNGWSYVEGNPINRLDPTGRYSVADYGINLTTFDGTAWSSENEFAVQMAATLIARRFVDTIVGISNPQIWESISPTIFKAVYGIRSGRQTELYWNPQTKTGNTITNNGCYNCRPNICQTKKADGTEYWVDDATIGQKTDCDCRPVGGYTHNERYIEYASLWDNYSATGGAPVKQLRKINNIIHEFGHAFNIRLGRIPEATVNGYTLDPAIWVQDDIDRDPAVLTLEWHEWTLAGRDYENTNSKIEGFYVDSAASGTMTWIQSPDVTASEVFADMFLGWTYNKWAADNYGNARKNFMDDNMRSWLIQAMRLP
jgi:hypothetical protein